MTLRQIEVLSRAADLLAHMVSRPQVSGVEIMNVEDMLQHSLSCLFDSGEIAQRDEVSHLAELVDHVQKNGLPIG